MVQIPQKKHREMNEKGGTACALRHLTPPGYDPVPSLLLFLFSSCHDDKFVMVIHCEDSAARYIPVTEMDVAARRTGHV
jgi:hypothetical protein